jgi:hypothetical protein
MPNTINSSEDEEIDIIGVKRSRTPPSDSAKEGDASDKLTKGPGHPHGDNKIKSPAPAAAPAPQAELPPLLPSNGSSAPGEPLTKRAKIQADLQPDLQPIPLGAAAADGNKSNPLSGAEPTPATNNNNKSTNNKDNGSKNGDLAPGEALRTWLEQNKVVEVEEQLIEELPDDVPLHQPTAEELASNAACAEFQALLPGLTPAKEAISLAAAAALKVAATGASARAVRMVVDAASDATGPPERLPYLYLLDSVVKLELRQSQEQKEGKEEEKKEEGAQTGFRRAVGAALQRLVHLLLGDDNVRKKVDKLLGIWQREGLIAASLIGPVVESLEHDAQRRRQEAAAAQAQKLKSLLTSNPLSARLKIMCTMPNGKQVVLDPPSHLTEPDDWTTPGELGIEVPATGGGTGRGPPSRKMKTLSSSSMAPKNSQGGVKSQKMELPVGYRAEEMSPWCTDEQYEAPEAHYNNGVGGVATNAANIVNGYYHHQQQQSFYQPPPPPMPPREQPKSAVEAGELDEFDQGALLGALGVSGGGNLEEGEIAVNPPPAPAIAPPLSAPSLFSMDAGQWGGMPMNDPAFAIGNNNGGGSMMQQEQYQWQQMQEQQMMVQQQEMAMYGGGMGMNTMLPQQHAGVIGGFGVGVPAMGMNGMGMQLPSQQQQYAMMNASMMGGSEYSYGNAGMGMQQGGGGGGDGYRGGGGGHRGHGRDGGGGHHKRDNHRQHHKNQQHDRNSRR